MAKRIPKIELYGTVQFKKVTNPLKNDLPKSYLIINLEKITSKSIDYIPKHFTLGFQIPPDLYESLKSQAEASENKKFKIKLNGELEFILNYQKD